MSESDDDQSSNIVGNDVTKRVGPLKPRYKTVTCPLQTVTQVTVLLPSKVGRLPCTPTVLPTYLTADRPERPPSMRPRFLPQGNVHRRLSHAQDHPDRPRARALTAARHRPEHFPAIRAGAHRAAALDKTYERACD